MSAQVSVEQQRLLVPWPRNSLVATVVFIIVNQPSSYSCSLIEFRLPAYGPASHSIRKVLQVERIKVIDLAVVSLTSFHYNGNVFETPITNHYLNQTKGASLRSILQE